MHPSVEAACHLRNTRVQREYAAAFEIFRLLVRGLRGKRWHLITPFYDNLFVHNPFADGYVAETAKYKPIRCT